MNSGCFERLSATGLRRSTLGQSFAGLSSPMRPARSNEVGHTKTCHTALVPAAGAAATAATTATNHCHTARRPRAPPTPLHSRPARAVPRCCQTAESRNHKRERPTPEREPPRETPRRRTAPELNTPSCQCRSTSPRAAIMALPEMPRHIHTVAMPAPGAASASVVGRQINARPPSQAKRRAWLACTAVIGRRCSPCPSSTALPILFVVAFGLALGAHYPSTPQRLCTHMHTHTSA